MSTIATITSLEQYDRMIAADVFPPREKQRLELLKGEIREMSPIGPRHESVVDFLVDWSTSQLPRGKFKVRVQNSVGFLDSVSAPEPDLCWVAPRKYSSGRPQARHVALLIEVAESSLKYDRGEKAEAYAAAGITDYWIVNIPKRCIEVFRDPSPSGYQDMKVYRGQDELHPLALPSITLRSDDIWQAI